MKITYNWLKEYVDFDLSPEELVEKLTMLGLEVDSVEKLNTDLEGVVVGEVKKKEKHPDADKLSLCEVDLGAERVSVVCGAPNVAAGQKVPVATVGTTLPGGLKIKKAKIRGVESSGMICSEKELGISSRADGIMVLNGSSVVGQPFHDVVQEDIMLDIDVTPNRPDCFGIFGIARDVAAATGSSLRKPAVEIAEGSISIFDKFKVTIEDKDRCPRFTARFVGKVQVKPSPWWLAQRLEAIGVRSINNIVDITNYVMMETGHPLHAYDYDLLQGQEIVVKVAGKGERFTTLDDRAHSLDSDVLMICDKDRSVGIAGVMGGQNTEVSESTENILLECAYFDPANIRRTAKRTDCGTEASKRFERGVDPNGLLYALNRAAQMIVELGDGTVATDIIDSYPKKIEPQTVRLRTNRVRTLLGVDIPDDEIKLILSRLELESSGEKELDVIAPTFRPDLTREADLIEEVARLYGYDNIPPDTDANIEQSGRVNREETAVRRLKSLLLASGFSEVVTYVLIRKKNAEIFTGQNHAISLLNPISEDLSTLRPSLIPGLLTTISWNINRKNINLKIFEFGNRFEIKGKGVLEETLVAGALTGSSWIDSWQKRSEPYNIFDTKGIVANLLNRMGLTDWHFQPAGNLAFGTGKALAVKSKGEEIGYLAEVHGDILKEFDIEQPVFVFEIKTGELNKRIHWQKNFSRIPKFPPVERDIAVVLDEKVEAEQVAHEVASNGGTYLQNVQLFDVFQGEQVGPGLKSLAFSLTFYSLEKTLTEKEIDRQISKILNSLSEKFSAQLRN